MGSFTIVATGLADLHASPGNRNNQKNTQTTVLRNKGAAHMTRDSVLTCI